MGRGSQSGWKWTVAPKRASTSLVVYWFHQSAKRLILYFGLSIRRPEDAWRLVQKVCQEAYFVFWSVNQTARRCVETCTESLPRGLFCILVCQSDGQKMRGDLYRKSAKRLIFYFGLPIRRPEDAWYRKRNDSKPELFKSAQQHVRLW